MSLLGVVLILIVASPVQGKDFAKEEVSDVTDDDDMVWFGPMPFISDRTMREDLIPVLTDASSWKAVLSETDVFKSYIMILPKDPIPGKTMPEVSDDELRNLIAFTQEHGLKVAFEVGGLRPRGYTYSPGKEYAFWEFRHLSRWLELGGHIDYLTTDHAIMMHIRPWMEQLDSRERQLLVFRQDEVNKYLRELTDELVDYFEVMHELIPSAKFGVIESLGYFHMHGPNGEKYDRTDPNLPVMYFLDYFNYLVEAMNERGLELDHFHIDFGFEGVNFDGRSKGKLDYGRILGVESYVQSKGVNVGVIVNAFHDLSAVNPGRDVANREAYENTLRFFREYVANEGKADQIIFQTWQPYPDTTGPEDKPYTVTNMFRDIMLSDEFDLVCR
jgi:hypothetical protein